MIVLFDDYVKTQKFKRVLIENCANENCEKFLENLSETDILNLFDESINEGFTNWVKSKSNSNSKIADESITFINKLKNCIKDVKNSIIQNLKENYEYLSNKYNLILDLQKKQLLKEFQTINVDKNSLTKEYQQSKQIIPFLTNLYQKDLFKIDETFYSKLFNVYPNIWKSINNVNTKIVENLLLENSFYNSNSNLYTLSKISKKFGGAGTFEFTNLNQILEMTKSHIKECENGVFENLIITQWIIDNLK